MFNFVWEDVWHLTIIFQQVVIPHMHNIYIMLTSLSCSRELHISIPSVDVPEECFCTELTVTITLVSAVVLIRGGTKPIVHLMIIA